MRATTAALQARVLELRRAGLSFAEIGRQLGYSRSRIQQLAEASGTVHPASERGETVGEYLARRKREIASHARAVDALVAAGRVE